MLQICMHGVRNGTTRCFIFGKQSIKMYFKLIHIYRCLAHVINLATQALLSEHSSAKHYDPAKPTDHEPDVDIFLRDEIGLVRAIVVKVSPSY